MPFAFREDGIEILRCIKCQSEYGLVLPENYGDRDIPLELRNLKVYKEPEDVLCPGCRLGTLY
jgi:Zn ribbon nucleic-acid-binding protein